MEFTLSYLFSTISLICWVIVFIPQLYKNYKTKDTSSLSLPFIGLWLLGDSINLFGAILQNLLPSTILLTVYFICADLLLLGQYVYYRYIYRRNPTLSGTGIINYGSIANNNELPGSVNSKLKHIKLVAGFIVVLLFVYLNLNTITRYFELDTNLLKEGNLGYILGWIACSIYQVSRIPQIFLNYRRKSVVGLSIVMFLCCVLGNLTFCLSVFTFSMDYQFLMANLPWLMGSGGTIFIDFVIFAQFYYYNAKGGKTELGYDEYKEGLDLNANLDLV